MDSSVLLIVPNRPLDLEKVKETLATYRQQCASTDSSKTIAPELLVLTIPRSRCLWQVLAPLLLFSHKETALHAVQCILQSCEPWMRRTPLPQRGECSSHNQDVSQKSWAQKRLLSKSRRFKSNILPYYSLLIQPSSLVQLEDSFTGRLITWEHKLIRAQSLTGYIATLGGGFFLCHHFNTAIALAQQQQQLALFLNDYGMYYRCMVNTAYNFVYAGKFRMARQLIQHVWEQTKSLSPTDPVLEKMCYSAMLFCRRMQIASRRLRPLQSSTPTDNNISRTIDDFARIRVVADQSLENDLNTPFNGDFRHVGHYISA